MDISVIIPVLNEQSGLSACLARVLEQPDWHQCIVVDGGSSDDTLAIARQFPVEILQAQRGRGTQLNAGAAAASGAVLLFLHADVALPARAARVIGRVLRDPDVVAGAFRTWTLPERVLTPSAPRVGVRRRVRIPLGPLLHLADIRSRYAKLPYGDQAMFVRAPVFFAAGGFPDEPLMEDLALSRRLWSFGRVQVAPERVRVSGRRFQSAPLRQTLWVNSFPLLHAAGVSTRFLARLYGAPR